MLTVINIFDQEIGRHKMHLFGKAGVAVLVMRGNLMLLRVNKIGRPDQECCIQAL